MAKILYVDGTSKTIKPKNGSNFELEELQNIVEGTIEIINLHDSDDILVINEVGKLVGLHKNYEATELAVKHESIFPSDYIVGTVLLCKSEEVK